MFDWTKTLAAPLALALTFAASPALADGQESHAGHAAHEGHAMAEQTGPALWQVSDEDTTIYLFGTVHVMRPEVEWQRDYISEALAASDEVVTEIDMASAESETLALLPMAMLPQDQTLRGLMTEENRAEYEALLATMGVPAGSFDRFEPWFASLTLGMMALMAEGFDAESGVEAVILAAANPDAARGALETVEYQFGVFDNLPLETQLRGLDESVEMADEATATIDNMVEAWVTGDADALAAIMNEGFSDPTMYEALLTTRNANWAEWIDERLDRPGTVFMAVGAGHLGGDTSVQALLEERGITAERLN